ncbi:hypothetical protein Scep_024693 [Stephania cephalantha]|uniref:Cytochrome P450 n=1 Tax=Stephania cephalantha TaxID=152367 RepID=A0AAP0HTY3_9MAGN
MEVSSVYLAVATLASLLLLSKLLFGSSSSKQQWPPGPKKLPFIGNLHQLGGGGDPLHWTLSDLARKYGKLMTVWFGSQKPNIVITDLDLAWELLVTKGADYWSRKMPYLAKITTAGFRTLSACDGGPYWESLRKGLHATALNPQTISSQTKLQEQDIADMISKMQQEADLNNGVVKPLHHLRELAIRLIYRLSFGTGVPIEDRFVKRMDELIEEQMGIWAAAHLVDVFEFTKHIPGLKPPLKETKAHIERIKALLRPCLAASKKYSLSGNNTHLSFLLSQGFSEEVILLNLFEVFNFGVDSTSASIVWALGFLILERETQEKLYKEVEGKLEGSRRMVRVEDIGGWSTCMRW